MASRLALLPLSAGLIALAPEVAEACSPDPCWGSTRVGEVKAVNAASIPVDGVLVLQTLHNSGVVDTDALAGLELTVTRSGQPVAGAIEDTDGAGVLVWRPAAPLEPGVYLVEGALENGEDDAYYDDYCGPDVVDIDLEFTVVNASAEPHAAPKVAAEESVEKIPSTALADHACCDGGFAYLGYSCGPEYVGWNEGFCAPTAATGYLRVVLEISSDAPTATKGLLLTTVRKDGEIVYTGLDTQFFTSGPKQTCTVVEQTNLATGEVVAAAEQCHGQDVAEQLGPQVLDPNVEIADKCTGPLYTCEVKADDDFSWDPEKCTPLVPEGEDTGETETDGPVTTSETDSGASQSGSESQSGGESQSGSDSEAGTDTATDADTAGEDLVEHGCACDAGPGDPAGLLGLAGLGLLGLRRRRR